MHFFSYRAEACFSLRRGRNEFVQSHHEEYPQKKKSHHEEMSADKWGPLVCQHYEFKGSTFDSINYNIYAL